MSSAFSPEHIEYQATRLSEPLTKAGQFAEGIASQMSADGFPITADNAARGYSELSQVLHESVATITRMGRFSSSQFHATASDYRSIEKNNMNTANKIMTGE